MFWVAFKKKWQRVILIKYKLQEMNQDRMGLESATLRLEFARATQLVYQIDAVFLRNPFYNIFIIYNKWKVNDEQKLLL